MTTGDLIVASLLQPRLAARRLMDANLPAGFGWSLMGLGIVLSAILGHLAIYLMPPPPDVAPVDLSPFALTALQAFSDALVVLAAYHLGRFAGGQGRFADVVLLVAWIEILMVAVQFMDLIFMVVLPPLAGDLPLVAIIAMLWCMANFLAEAHGFASPWPVLGAMIGVSFVIGFGVLTVLAQLGIQIGAPNV